MGKRNGTTRLVGVGSAALICLSGAVTTALAQDINSEFRICADRESKAAVGRAVREHGVGALYGYHTEIDKVVLIICQQRANPTVREMQYVSSAVGKSMKDRAMALIQKEQEAQRKKEMEDAPRLRAEKEAKERAGVAYFSCLRDHAQTLALSSGESADIIAQAAFSSCSKERQSVVDAHNKGHDKLLGEEIVKVADQTFYKRVLLEVITARAQPVPAPAQKLPNNLKNSI